MRDGRNFVRAIVFVGGWVTISSAFAQIETPSWRTRLQGLSQSARAGTGVTDPILSNLPEWAQDEGVSPGLFISNPALLSLVQNEKGLFFPLTMGTLEKGGVFSGSPFRVNPWAPSELVRQVGLDSSQQREWTFLSSFVSREVAFGLSWDRVQVVHRDEMGKTYYQDSIDAGFRFGIGSELLKITDQFKSHLGVGLKVLRREGTFLNSNSLVAENTKNLPLKKAMGFGADIGVLTQIEKTPFGVTPSGLEVALVWRDLGTTQFIGNLAERSAERSPPYPGNLIFGLGFLAPKYLDSHRDSIRLEYGEWGRDMKAINRLAVGWEHRFPKILTLNLGYKHPGWRGGMSLRFQRVRLEIASFVDEIQLHGKSSFSRLHALELSSVF